MDSVLQTGEVASAGEGPLNVLSVAGPSTPADADVAGLVNGDVTPQVHVRRGRINRSLHPLDLTPFLLSPQ